MSKVCVIGGGAAGMMAAISASKAGDKVTLIEKNEKLGKKVYITGKGRCNVTNACQKDIFFNNVLGNSKFLYSAYSIFDNNMLMEMLEDYGCSLKVERGDRVFPVSDHSSDIIKAFERGLKQEKVDIMYNTAVSSIIVEDGVCKGVSIKAGKDMLFDKVIICTGGLSYRTTGSTGDGYKWASDNGHTIKACKPALVPLTTDEEWVYDLQGLSLKNVKLTLIVDGKKKFSDTGEMLFTHFGLSGPLVLSASSCLAGCKDYKECQVVIDNKPALSIDVFDKRLQRELEEGNNKEIKNILGNIYPVKMAKIITDLAKIDPYKKCNVVSKEERQRLLDVTKNMTIDISGTRDFNEAIITHGGVNLKEINPKTMESKLVKNLYFAGEVIDLDAYTGGFNLQIAFSTGYLAGQNG